MILLLLKSYLFLLLTIAGSAFFIFVSGLYWIVKKEKHRVTQSQTSSLDVSAIAGEDKIATQLDLAHAYMAADKKKLAREMLASVLRAGGKAQKEEAKRLLKSL